MDSGRRNSREMSTPPRVPKWIREFSYPSEGATRASPTFRWTNVFHLVPNNKSLYPVALRADWKKQFNDWNSRILLLAKDGCPTRVIRDRIDRGEPQPWRYGQRELGDEMGWLTNEKLYRFASKIPGGKLYGSAAANMLYDDDRTSRGLSGFYDGKLHEFLKDALASVLESMQRVEWVACLGAEAWFLTGNTIGIPHLASRHREHRDSYKPVTGMIGKKKISAFPLYHPAARRVDDLMEKGWGSFGKALSTSKNAAVDREVWAVLATHLTAGTTGQPTARTQRNYAPGNSALKHRRIVTATLPRRQCRIKFMGGKDLVHISPEYDSGNTWAKIIACARSKRGGTPANLTPAAVPIPQVLTSVGWIDVNE